MFEFEPDHPYFNVDHCESVIVLNRQQLINHLCASLRACNLMPVTFGDIKVEGLPLVDSDKIIIKFTLNQSNDECIL